MSQRIVRSAGRPVYGRVQPLSRGPRRGPRRPRLSVLQRRGLIIFVLLLLAGWGIVQLFALRTVTVSAPARMAEIESASRKLVAGNLWWGNLVTFSSDDFIAKLKQTDPSLRTVTVKRKWFHTIVVTSTLKQASLGWSTGNQTYVLDKDGTVIGVAAGPVIFPVVYDGSNLPVQVGQRVASVHFVEFASQIVAELAQSGIGVTRLDIKDTTFDLSAQTNKGYRLLFDTNRSTSEEIADLKAVQRLLVAQKRTPAEYIDLRIAGKAYYK